MLFYDLVKKDLDQLEIEMEKCIPSKPAEVYTIILPYIRRGGKRIRPLLAFLCARAVGGKTENVIKPAALIELFHNFTLIHDDIEDNSDLRRGKPTLHTQFGIPVALNSGDALYTRLWELVLQLNVKNKDTEKIRSFYASSFRKVVEGQGIELNWHANDIFNISEENYTTMIGGKTSALLAVSCELGAYLGGGTEKEQKLLSEMGYYFGLSFQIQDDILNVTGNVDKYKKEIGGDISEGKRTLMVVYVLRHGSPKEQEIVKTILKSRSKNKKDIETVTSIFKSTGALDYAQAKAIEFQSRAIANITFLNESENKNALYELAQYIVKRQE